MQSRKGTATAAVCSELQPAQGSESDLEGEKRRENCRQSLGNWLSFEGDRARLTASRTLSSQQKPEAYTSQRAALWDPEHERPAETLIRKKHSERG